VAMRKGAESAERFVVSWPLILVKQVVRLNKHPAAQWRRCVATALKSVCVIGMD
jgi:hypothetical protein